MSPLYFGLFPIGHLALNPLERAYPPNPEIGAPTGITVLGGMEEIAPEHGDEIAQVNEAGERLIVTMELANRFPEAQIVFAGGKVALSPLDEIEFSVGPDLLRRLGLTETGLIVEDRSRTTAENAVLARDKVGDQADGSWVLVTSAWHVPRALGTFCAAGWRNLPPYPVDFRGGSVVKAISWNLAGNLGELNFGVKEWIGLLAYRITGRTQAFFPAGCS